MKILAVDTATVSCSVAIVADGYLKAELTQATGETHARHLMTMVDTVLEMSNETMAGIEGFAVTTGPGTFTGLRIGLSTVQGLALAGSKPVAGVSSLDALAAQVVSVPGVEKHLLCATLDARRQEVYYGLYRAGGQGFEPASEPGVAPPKTIARLIDEPCLMVGAGALLYRELFQERLAAECSFAPPGVNTIRAETVARLASARLGSLSSDANGVLQPLYIRKSDAEVNAVKAKRPAIAVENGSQTTKIE